MPIRTSALSLLLFLVLCAAGTAQEQQPLRANAERIYGCTNCGRPLPRTVAAGKLKALAAGAALLLRQLSR
ncbi:MAG TPA: hypothetical protein VIB38_08325 [Aestuariivirgaceae bacterium]|jgi:hypothetical protein